MGCWRLASCTCRQGYRVTTLDMLNSRVTPVLMVTLWPCQHVQLKMSFLFNRMTFRFVVLRVARLSMLIHSSMEDPILLRPELTADLNDGCPEWWTKSVFGFWWKSLFRVVAISFRKFSKQASSLVQMSWCLSCIFQRRFGLRYRCFLFFNSYIYTVYIYIYIYIHIFKIDYYMYVHSRRLTPPGKFLYSSWKGTKKRKCHLPCRHQFSGDMLVLRGIIIWK